MAGSVQYLDFQRGQVLFFLEYVEYAARGATQLVVPLRSSLTYKISGLCANISPPCNGFCPSKYSILYQESSMIERHSDALNSPFSSA
jgi:hypothetical protein